jgi:ABC-type bacteriocin/lantibiotic exporter with double-glycine peptidase domain
VKRSPRACLLSWIALCAWGCLYRGAAVDADVRELQARPGWTVLADVPLLRQRGAQDCGFVALSALLRYWRVPAEPRALREEIQLPSDRPVSAAALRSLLQRRGFRAFLIAGERADLERHLRKGRPVLVGMLKPYAADRQLAHYELVVGIHPADGVLTMDPASGWQRYPFEGFEREWSGAGHLTLIAAPEG